MQLRRNSRRIFRRRNAVRPRRHRHDHGQDGQGATRSSSTTDMQLSAALRQPLDDPRHAGLTASRATRFIFRVTSQVEQWEPFRPVSGEIRARVMEGAERQRRPVQPRRHGLLRTDEVRRRRRNKTQTPIDVYDSVTMSCIVALSEQSIAKGSAGGVSRFHPWQVEDPQAGVCSSKHNAVVPGANPVGMSPARLTFGLVRLKKVLASGVIKGEVAVSFLSTGDQ